MPPVKGGLDFIPPNHLELLVPFVDCLYLFGNLKLRCCPVLWIQHCVNHARSTRSRSICKQRRMGGPLSRKKRPPGRLRGPCPRQQCGSACRERSGERRGKSPSLQAHWVASCQVRCVERGRFASSTGSAQWANEVASPMPSCASTWSYSWKPATLRGRVSLSEVVEPNEWSVA